MSFLVSVVNNTPYHIAYTNWNTSICKLVLHDSFMWIPAGPCIVYKTNSACTWRNNCTKSKLLFIFILLHAPIKILYWALLSSKVKGTYWALLSDSLLSCNLAIVVLQHTKVWKSACTCREKQSNCECECLPLILLQLSTWCLLNNATKSSALKFWLVWCKTNTKYDTVPG